MFNGPWKEGRLGAVSLCYVDPAPDQLLWIADNHRAVGIRATLALTHTDPLADLLPLLVERKWDLIPRDTPTTRPPLAQLRALDARPLRGLMLTEPQRPDTQPPAAPDWQYRLADRPGDVAPETILPAGPTLPTSPADAPVDPLIENLRAVLSTARWQIKLLDADTLATLGQPDHARLLQFLGDHHDRIWCAPVQDILAWHLTRATR